jgi:hypothetical protein
VSLTREVLDKWLAYARKDLASAPADGMLTYLIEKCFSEGAPETFTRRDVEVVAVAYYKAMVQYTRM